GDPGHRPAERRVLARQRVAAGGGEVLGPDDDRPPRPARRRERVLQQGATPDDDPRLGRPEARGATPGEHDGVVHDGGRLALGRGRHGARCQSPDLPPVLATRRTSVSSTDLSRPLTMSTTASPATATAVNASISTPVRSTIRTVAVTSTPWSPTTRSTTAPCTPMTCASGRSSAVRFAPAIPAMRATASTSPLGTVPSRSAATISGEHRTTPVAVAERTVGCLAVTSTMRACPRSSRCVKLMAPLSHARPARHTGRSARPVASVEQQHAHRVARLDRGDVGGDDGDGVGVRERAHAVGAGAARRRLARARLARAAGRDDLGPVGRGVPHEDELLTPGGRRPPL